MNIIDSAYENCVITQSECEEMIMELNYGPFWDIVYV